MRVRRGALTGALVLSLLGVPFAADGQPAGRVPRIGVLSGNVPGNDRCLEALRRGLTELGYREGATHTLEVRWGGEGTEPEYRRLAEELVRLKVDLFVSFVGASMLAGRASTATTPVVMAASLYPVEQGIIASLARPGGHITGMATFTPELFAKRVQLLKEAVPTAARVAVLRFPGRVTDLIVKDLEAGAQQLGIRLRAIEVSRAEELPRAFETVSAPGPRR